MKNLPILLFSATLGLCATALAADPIVESSAQLRVVSAPIATGPVAVAVGVRGKSEVSMDGITFAQIKADQQLKEGAVIRTGDGGRVDLYFKRTGVVVRLQKDGELKLTKMAHATNNAAITTATQLELSQGRVFTLVRATIPGTFEITSAKGLKVAANPSKDRHMIAAGSSKTAPINSINLANPILPGGKAGAKFDEEDFKRFSESTDDAVSQLLEFDELKSLAEDWTRGDVGSGN